MHRCLTIVEVQRVIFREVHHLHGGKVTLARLACTCRAFNNPALDVLWARLDSFVYLIQCLPQDLWKIGPKYGRMTFQRAMSLRDWRTFSAYSSRIRDLFQSFKSETPTDCSGLGGDVIFAFSNPPSHGPLIPHLRTLYWDKSDNKYAPLLRFLLTPSLVTLSLPSCALRFPEVSVLTSIGTLCPSLKTLCIALPQSFGIDAKGKKVLSEALLYLHGLESLTCPALDEAAIIHLTRLPTLVDLDLALQLDFELEKVQSYIAPPSFAFIDSLTLHANALPTLTSLFELMRFKPTTVSFVLATTPTPDALRLFFLALTSACSSEQLSRVSLTTSSKRLQRVPLQQVTLATFQSLLAFPNIHLFKVDVPCNMALDDEAIVTLTKHWPDLTVLSINGTSGWAMPSRVTHHGLTTLLSRCPGLTEFALAIDFGEVDGPHVDAAGGRPGDGVANHTCVIANFSTSAILSPAKIAAYLSDVCPELKSVKSAWLHGVMGEEEDWDEVEAHRKRWEKAEDLLPTFSAVRKQCMGRAQKKAKEGSGVGG